MDIKAEVKRIEQLDDYFFIVPDYQREYVWKADNHVTRFMDDIGNEFDSGKKQLSNYFIGSSIIVKRKDGNFEVIDGQQRLTTITLALCAMRDYIGDIKEVEEDLLGQADDLVQNIKELLFKYSNKDKKRRIRLELQYEESKDYLDKLIQQQEFTETETPSIKRMREAYEMILECLGDYEKIGQVELLDFCSYFLGNVEVVFIIPDDVSSALKIFETINERGEGLNAMDLLKNLIFSKASPDDFSKIKDIWKDIIQSLVDCKEGDKPLRFLRYFLMARYHDGLIREDSIYRWIVSDEGKKKIGYEKNAIRFAKEVAKSAEKYSDFVQMTNDAKEDEKFPWITGIGYLGKSSTRQHLILLLALNDSFPSEDLNLLALNIEALYFYYTTNRILTKSYEELFAVWATKIRNLKSHDDLKEFIVVEIKKEIEKRIQSFDINFPNLREWDIHPQYRLKYILGRIENYIRQQSNLPLHPMEHYQDLQLEHILPQTPKNRNETTFPDYYGHVQKIGNLTLIEAPLNQSLNNCNDVSNNAWFEQKKQTYLKSENYLSSSIAGISIGKNTAFNKFNEKYLQEFDKWNYESITDRQSLLFILAKQVWKVHTN